MQAEMTQAVPKQKNQMALPDYDYHLVIYYRNENYVTLLLCNCAPTDAYSLHLILIGLTLLHTGSPQLHFKNTSWWCTPFIVLFEFPFKVEYCNFPVHLIRICSILHCCS